MSAPNQSNAGYMIFGLDAYAAVFRNTYIFLQVFRSMDAIQAVSQEALQDTRLLRLYFQIYSKTHQK